MRQAHIARTCLVVLLLLVLFTGCGTQGQRANTASPASTAISNSPTSDPSLRLTPNKNGIAIDLSGLHIDASKGVQCPDNSGPLGGVTSGNILVLATDRLTYNANELQQMRDYVESAGSPTPNPMPDTLHWVLGGPTDTGHVVYIDGLAGGYIDNCGVELGLTNTSQNAIQIANVGVQLAGDTQQNNYHYRLIDMCTITPYCRSGGGPGDCSQYSATIKLDTGPINAVFSAIPAGSDSSCGELTLNPKEEKTLSVYIYSAQNLIYSVVPQLVLTTGSGPNTLTLTDLTSTLAFANGSQYTCYALRGDIFVAETPPLSSSVCI
jgi:hypothetical protein